MNIGLYYVKRISRSKQNPYFRTCMTKGILSTFLFSLFFIYSIAQKSGSKPAQKGLPVEADCKKAIKLSTTKKGNYGPTVSPKSFGKVMDIKACDEQDVFTFERERNSAWYYFVVPDDGDVILEITSVNPKNDYDFMLYKWTDSCFCDNVRQGYLVPVRTNLSHSDSKEGVPVIGLAYDAEQENIPVGVGEPFSRSLFVRKGEKYYLALDNVHNKGQGHIVKLYYLKEITIGGTVIDEKKKPVPATVWVENMDGKIIAVTKSNEDGKYLFTAKLKDDEFYSILYTSDSSFIECRQIALSEFAKTGYAQKDLKTTLLKLVRGKKYILDGISYNTKSGRLLPASYPSLNALARLMMKYKTMDVHIEGHVNNPAVASNSGPDKKLGEEKANEIYDYLLNRGVANNRMTPVSFGSLFMLYPKPSNSVEADANNRIEIFFLEENK